jgi:hypothetical protein
MIYADVFILYEYNENVGFWIWWWSAGVKIYDHVKNHGVEKGLRARLASQAWDNGQWGTQGW